MRKGLDLAVAVPRTMMDGILSEVRSRLPRPTRLRVFRTLFELARWYLRFG